MQPKCASISATVAKRKPLLKAATLPALTSFRLWSPRTSSSHTVLLTMSPASFFSSVASTSDLTVRCSGRPSSAATSSQVLLPGVGVFFIGSAGAARCTISGSASASSMLAA